MKCFCISVFCAAALALSGCQTEMPSPQRVSVDAVYVYNADVLSNSDSPSAVVAKLSSADLAGCPQDFAKAYRAYVSAWSDFAETAKPMYSKNVKKATEDLRSFVETFGDNPSKAAVELKRGWPEFADAIDKAATKLISTLAETKSMGVKYNAVYR